MQKLIVIIESTLVTFPGSRKKYIQYKTASAEGRQCEVDSILTLYVNEKN